MEKNYSRRDFLKKSVKGLFGLVASGGLLSFIGCKKKSLFDGKIDGQRVIYYDGPFLSDRMEIYSDGKLSKVIKDFDEDEVIGNHVSDRYVVVIDENKKITYAQRFVIDENGVKFEGTDPVSEKAREIGKQRLKEATKLYQDLKEKIGKELESKLL
ncbi:hypothetical protein ES703_20522 [subsurface metagenome]